jgi:hypothetical protein
VSLPGGEEMDFERGFGDVDADSREVRAIHGDVPFLPMRARAAVGPLAAQATVRANIQRPAAIWLCDGVLSTEEQSICRRPLRVWLRSHTRSREH